MKKKLERIKNDPKMQEAVRSLKPQKSIWGFLGVVVFFILPEIVAFIWGADITAYAKEHIDFAEGADYYYLQALIFLFEEGGSYLNLAIGFALLIWLFF